MSACSTVGPKACDPFLHRLTFPVMYSHDLSQAQVSARASFSICAYLDSVGVNALDRKDTGPQDLSGWS